MAREGRSHVRKQKKGLSGWLPDESAARARRGGAAVCRRACAGLCEERSADRRADAHALTNLPEIKLGDFDLSRIKLPDVSRLTEKLPKWAYGVNPNGLTIKTLRAGDGEAVFVCADGYTMLARRGQRNGRGALRPAAALRREPPERGGRDELGGRAARRDENGAGADASRIISLCRRRRRRARPTRR